MSAVGNPDGAKHLRGNNCKTREFDDEILFLERHIEHAIKSGPGLSSEWHYSCIGRDVEKLYKLKGKIFQ